MLKKGLNEMYVRVGGPVVDNLVFPKNEIQLNIEHPTVPVIVAGAAGNDSLRGAVVMINASGKALKNYSIEAVSGGKRYTTVIPDVQPMSSRKVAFSFCGAGVQGKGHFDCVISLVGQHGTIDEKTLSIEAAGPGESYSVTFESRIDGSLQYYAVTPQGAAQAAARGAGQGAGNGGA